MHVSGQTHIDWNCGGTGKGERAKSYEHHFFIFHVQVMSGSIRMKFSETKDNCSMHLIVSYSKVKVKVAHKTKVGNTESVSKL